MIEVVHRARQDAEGWCSGGWCIAGDWCMEDQPRRTHLVHQVGEIEEGGVQGAGRQAARVRGLAGLKAGGVGEVEAQGFKKPGQPTNLSPPTRSGLARSSPTRAWAPTRC